MLGKHHLCCPKDVELRVVLDSWQGAGITLKLSRVSGKDHTVCLSFTSWKLKGGEQCWLSTSPSDWACTLWVRPETWHLNAPHTLLGIPACRKGGREWTGDPTPIIFTKQVLRDIGCSSEASLSALPAKIQQGNPQVVKEETGWGDMTVWTVLPVRTSRPGYALPARNEVFPCCQRPEIES
jgi:hypothetical protein